MLAVRLIPCLDILNARVVKGVRFEGLKDAGDPVELAIRYNDQNADELVFLDIAATNEKRKTTVELAQKLARHLFIPFTIGGGIASLGQIDELVSRGADKVSLNSSAVRRPGLVEEGAARFGSQCIVVAIDVKRNAEGTWNVHTHAGKKNTGMDATAWAKEVVARGAGEILLTSMDNDGNRQGFDLEITRRISEAVPVPVIASGGGGAPRHFVEAVKLGKADAVLAAGVFHYGDLTVGQVKSRMRRAGIPVRLDPPEP